MKEFPDKYFDLAIVDIPYGIGVGKMAYLKEVKTTVKQKNGTRLNANRNKKIFEFKEWDKKPPPQEYFDELRRISREQIIWGINYVDWKGVGSGRIKWDKGVPDGVSFKRYETAYCSLIDNEIEMPLLWAGMCQAKSIYEPMVQQGNKKLNEKRIHPTHKPIMLYKLLLKNYANPDFKIIDTHAGSCSSVIAFLDFGCQWIAFEIDKDYYQSASKRIENHKKLPKPFFNDPLLNKLELNKQKGFFNK
jgi:site-specific DNA-methyltransferase (adenine-specific)